MQGCKAKACLPEEHRKWHSVRSLIGLAHEQVVLAVCGDT